MESSAPTLTGPWPRARATLALALLAVGAGGLTAAFLNRGYVDFGDGNYLYISWRLTQGAVLYRDILSPQPPLHTALGAGLVWLGDRLGPAILTVRAAQILIHLLTGWLLYRLARRWEFGRGTAVLAAAVWWLCPINFRWSLGWQSENIEIPLLLAAQILLARRGRLTLLLSGLCGAAALLCNMTAAPYVLFNGLFALVAFRAAGLPYWLGLLGGWGSVAGLVEMATGAFFENTVLNQVGSYPADGFWSYASAKIVGEARNVLRAEGVWVGLAIAGMIVAGIESRRRWRDPVALYRGIYSLGGLLSITYVTKGGTADYIFSLGEPCVALWAAHCLVRLAQSGAFAGATRRRAPGLWQPSPQWLLAALVFVLGCVQVAPWHWRYLSQQGFEWPEDRMGAVVAEIERRTGPDDLILAPPYFAFITRRRIVEDLSETFLWYIKWVNEKRRGRPGRGVAMMERVAQALREKRVALVVYHGLSPELITHRDVLEVGTWGREDRYVATITPIRWALFQNYRRVGPRLESNLPWRRSEAFPGVVYRQEDLTFWIPQGQRTRD